MSRPNILFILSDDHAANGISAYGSRLSEQAKTPNIDRIGDQGMRLDNCFCTNSICTPSRATILTGQHSHINGVRTLSDSMPQGSPALQKLLKDGGYKTALFGKWHLHSAPEGFNDWTILPCQGEYFDPYFLTENQGAASTEIAEDALDIKQQGPQVFKEILNEDYHFGHALQAKGYVTDLITDLTLQWLKEQKGEEPFFLCCHHKAPHDFFEYKRIFEDLYNDVEFAEPSTLFESEDTQQEISRAYGTTVSERWEPRNMVKHLQDPDYPNGGAMDFSGMSFQEKARSAYQKYMQDYLRTVHSIDLNVGRLLDYLDESGLSENTIVIYSSDQGMMLGEHDHIDKRWIFDESQQMPFLIRYPREIAPGRANRDMIDNCDFAPTLLDYAGIAVPEKMQGRSFRPQLRGEKVIHWRQSVYYRYWMHMAHHWVPAHLGIRTDQWKLIFFYGRRLDASGCDYGDSLKETRPGLELYDIKNDPEETRNLANDPQYAEVLESMKKQLVQIKREVGDFDEEFPEMMELQRRFLGDAC